jgi:hypothetical protein
VNALDHLIAKTQRNITYVYCGLFGGALAALIFLKKPLDESTKTILITLLGVLGTLITMQNQFWFARQRTAGVPDPSPTTVIQTGGPNAPTTTTVSPTSTTVSTVPRSTGAGAD